MLKRKRTNINSYKQDLLECYRGGMTSLQSEDQRKMADDLCSRTNLKRSQVKNWLSNHKKTISGTAGLKRTPKFNQRQKSGRDLFLREHMKGTQNGADKMSELAAKWLVIKDTPEGHEYTKRAKQEPPTDVTTMDIEETKAFLNQQFMKLNKLLSVMESAGTEAVVYCYNSKTGTAHFAGTDKGTRFRNKRPEIFANFLAFVTDGSGVEVDIKEMRKKVIELLEMRYCELTGVKKGCFDALKAGRVVLDGLPIGMTFDNPWNASKKKLSAIIANQSQIKFSISTPSGSAIAPAQPAQSNPETIVNLRDNCTATTTSVVDETTDGFGAGETTNPINVTQEMMFTTSVSDVAHADPNHSVPETIVAVIDNNKVTTISVVKETIGDAFGSQKETKNLVSTECSTFKAGDAIRSGARNAKLDVRGVFGSVCRHEFPVLFMDMKHAERLAYPIYLIEELRKTLGDTRLQVVYDIGCVLTRHLERTKQRSILDNIQLGLPIFHAYGHGASCQVQYSVRCLDGFGLTDGEGTERLWSFLRPLSKMTKEMTPTHRKELLNDAINQFCRRKIAGLATWFEMRVTRATDVQKEARNNLKEMTELLQVTDDEVRTWALEQKQQFVTAKPVSKSATSWETSYVTKLQSYYSMHNQTQSGSHDEVAIEVQQKMTNLEVSLRKTELSQSITRWKSDHPVYMDCVDTLAIASKTKILRQLHQDSSSRAFLVQLLSKYCDGQMIAIRLSKQVQKATVAVKKGLQLYNAVTGMTSGSHLRQTITEKEALNPSSAIFVCVLDNQQNVNLSVPAAQRWKAVEHHMLCLRASEELKRIADDIRATVEHYCRMHNALSQAIHSVSSAKELALLKKRTLEMELIMQRIWKVAREHLVEIGPMPSLNDSQITNQTADDASVLDNTEANAVDSDCDNDSDVDCY